MVPASVIDYIHFKMPDHQEHDEEPLERLGAGVLKGKTDSPYWRLCGLTTADPDDSQHQSVLLNLLEPVGQILMRELL